MSYMNRRQELNFLLIILEREMRLHEDDLPSLMFIVLSKSDVAAFIAPGVGRHVR